MLSFWERESFRRYDRIIIGSGIVGLSTACSVLEKDPGLRVLVLEKGLIPSGASTRNAGFACYGSAAEILSEMDVLGTDKALELVALRFEGLQRLRSRLGDAKIGYEELGGGEIFRSDSPPDPDRLEDLNSRLSPIFGKKPFEVAPLSEAAHLGFQNETISGFVRNRVEGQIDTGKMMQTLMAYCRHLGAEILTGASCLKPIWNGKTWEIGLESHPLVLEAPGVAVCTNAFTSSLFPEWDVKPGRGQVLITHPIPGLRFQGLFHFDEGYYYFRNVGSRVLFGGGRNLDFEGETTTETALNPQIQGELDRLLRELILPLGTRFEVDMRWSGIMAFGKEKVPLIRDLGNGLLAGVRMNGMGVAIGSRIGQQLASMW